MFCHSCRPCDIVFFFPVFAVQSTTFTSFFPYYSHTCHMLFWFILCSVSILSRWFLGVFVSYQNVFAWCLFLSDCCRDRSTQYLRPNLTISSHIIFQRNHFKCSCLSLKNRSSYFFYFDKFCLNRYHEGSWNAQDWYNFRCRPTSGQSLRIFPVQIHSASSKVSTAPFSQADIASPMCLPC